MSKLLEEVWRQQNPIAFAKAKKSGSRKKDKNGPNCKNSTECNVGGKRYCIPKTSECGGKKKKAVKSPAGQAAVKQLSADGQKQASTGFRGAIGGFKGGKVYEKITPEMAKVARDMGVSEGQLKNGRVPKKVQDDLVKEFDRLAGGGGGSSLRQAKETAETEEQPIRGKRVPDFYSLVRETAVALEGRKRNLETVLALPTNARTLKKQANDHVREIQDRVDKLRNLTPEQRRADLENEINNLRLIKIEAKKQGSTKVIDAAIKRKQAEIRDTKNASKFEKTKAQWIAGAEALLETAKNNASSEDFKLISARNRYMIAEAKAGFEMERKRLDRIAQISTDQSARQDAIRALNNVGVQFSGDLNQSMTAARSNIQDKIREYQDNPARNEASYKNAIESFDQLRALQAKDPTIPTPRNQFLEDTMERLSTQPSRSKTRATKLEKEETVRALENRLDSVRDLTPSVRREDLLREIEDLETLSLGSKNSVDAVRDEVKRKQRQIEDTKDEVKFIKMKDRLIDDIDYRSRMEQRRASGSFKTTAQKEGAEQSVRALEKRLESARNLTPSMYREDLSRDIENLQTLSLGSKDGVDVIGEEIKRKQRQIEDTKDEVKFIKMKDLLIDEIDYRLRMGE